MSVTTSQRLNIDTLNGLLPAAATLSWTGGRLQDPGVKVITPAGTDDATLQVAVTAAAAAFVDYDANREALLSKARTALTANATYLAVGSPTAAQVAAQVRALTMETTAVIRLLIGQLDSTSGS